jgi:hypothetical protein
MQVIAKSL